VASAAAEIAARLEVLRKSRRFRESGWVDIGVVIFFGVRLRTRFVAGEEIAASGALGSGWLA
jgi:hypothetical protein